MTENGALINASDNSTITVTQRQHGHMQLNNILRHKIQIKFRLEFWESLSRLVTLLESFIRKCF